MTTDLQAAVRAAAVAAYSAGLCVLPARADGSKAPGVAKWKAYETARPDEDTMRRLFPLEGGPQGLGFICGAVSGGLELFEFDDADAERRFREAAAFAGGIAAETVAALDAGYSERTPGGGLHWLYYAEGGARPNTKLATSVACKRCGHAPDVHYPEDADGGAGCFGCMDTQPGEFERHAYSVSVLIETRGEGGWVVVAPSGGPTHATGNPYVMVSGGPDAIPTLSVAAREVIWTIARGFDETGEPESENRVDTRPVLVPIAGDADERPGDRFNRLASWADVLEGTGWRRINNASAAVGHWNRPGAQDKRGIDATTDGEGHPYFYVFSTSVPEFKPETGYDKFGTYAILHHGGDLAAAGRAIAGDQRYGSGGYDPGPLVAPRKRPSAAVAGDASDASANIRPIGGGGAGRDRDEAAGHPANGANRLAPRPFDHAFPADHFVTRWIEYGIGQCDAAYEYHEAAALVALSAVVPGVKARYSFWPRGLAANLYVMTLGASSTSRKSTAMAYAERAIELVNERAILPEKMSPEAFIEQLSWRQDGAAVLVQDELGKALAEWGARGRPQGQAMLNMLLSSYDGKPIRYARHSKRIKGGGTEGDADNVERSHLTVIGAATPSIYAQYGIAEMTEDGLLPRFAIVMGKHRPPPVQLTESEPDEDPEFIRLVAHLNGVHRWAQGHETPARLEPAALEALRAFLGRMDREAEDYPILGRIAPMAFKVAMLSAVGANTGTAPRGDVLRIFEADIEAGIKVAGRWATNAVAFVDELRSGSHAPEEQKAEAVIAYLRRHGGTALRRDVMRSLKLTKRTAEELRDTLRQREVMIEGEETERVAGSGPKPAMWQLIG